MLLPAKWTIRNDTGGCHFSAKCRALSARDDGSPFCIFLIFFFFFTPRISPLVSPSLAKPDDFYRTGRSLFTKFHRVYPFGVLRYRETRNS